jgi:hypothetical protein
MDEKTQPHPTGQHDQPRTVGEQISHQGDAQGQRRNYFERFLVFFVRLLRGDLYEDELYDIWKLRAKSIKTIIQMFIGIALAVLILIEFIHYVADPIPLPLLTAQTLGIVGTALAVSTAFELAYTLFTPGPDEAVDPLLTGLAAFILLVVSGITTITLDNASGVALLVLVLIVLFILRYFFIEEKGLRHLLDGKATDAQQSSASARSREGQAQQSSGGSGTNDASSPPSHPTQV